MRYTIPLLAVLLSGCTARRVLDELPDADLTDPAEAEFWIHNASAPALYMLAATPMAVVSLSSEESTCPAMSEADGVVTYTGGCTDESGTTWTGTMRVEDEKVIRYQGLSYESPDADCGGVTHATFEGSWSVEDADVVGNFVIDVVMETSGFDDDCTPSSDRVALAYVGDLLEEGDEGQIQTWSGSGTVGSDSHGKGSVSTNDELIDKDICDSEAASGKTRIEAGGDVIEVFYDGAVDCSEDSTVTWTLNGEDQGTMSGVECASLAGGRGAAGGLVLALGLALARRRRD